MELTKNAQLIKHELALELQKYGSSIEEFEEALSNINTGEGVYKVAVFGEKLIAETMDRGIDTAFAIPELAFKTSLTGGALAGLGMDEMDKSVDTLNKALAREREKIHLVKRITTNLKREHGLD